MTDEYQHVDLIQDDSSSVPQAANKPYLAGIWLLSGIPLVAVLFLIMDSFIHRQDLSESLGVPSILVILGGTAYLWANTLAKRSGYLPNWRIGLVGAISFVSLIMVVELGAYDLFFGNVMKLVGVTQTVGGTRPEFYVVFVIWTGMVAGGCGLGLGLALKDAKVALKLLGIGFLTGAVVFSIVALIMELFGFRVGTPRSDGLPSMPIVTLVGISLSALIGSELFGRVLARNKREYDVD